MVFGCVLIYVSLKTMKMRDKEMTVIELILIFPLVLIGNWLMGKLCERDIEG